MSIEMPSFAGEQYEKRMKKSILKQVCFGCLWMLFALSLTASASKIGSAPLPLADPYVFYENGQYFAYGTTGDEGIQVFTSRDLRTWSLHGWALRREESTATRWFWAPEVYHIGERYLMYFTGNQEIRAAWSDSPCGPFTEVTSGPLWKWNKGEYNIDNHLYIDTDGTPYIFFVETLQRASNIIYMARLSDDLTTILPQTSQIVIRPEQPWEMLDGLVNEGPYVIKHGDTYYLTYSGNGYTSQDYAIGVATADRITGPWTKVDYNPVLRRVHGLVGVGHHSFFRDKKGRLRIAFHAHKSTSKVHPRDMHIGFVEFRKNPTGGPDILYINPKKIIDCKMQ